jgi:hypothetical protein
MKRKGKKRQVRATRQPNDPIDFEEQRYPNVYPDDKTDTIGRPDFKPENNPQLIDIHVRQMAAAGAAADATLYDRHFDGGELNSLGRAKVALMLSAAPKGQVLTIYVPTDGSDERVQVRLASVEKYWKDSQYAAVQLQTKEGVNPFNTTPASSGLAGLRRIERPDQQGGANSSSSGSSTGSGSSGTGGSSSGASSR